MKISPVNLNIKKCNMNFKNNSKINLVTSSPASLIDLQKTLQAQDLLNKSENVLSRISIIEKIADKKYQEAKDIYFSWQQGLPNVIPSLGKEYKMGLNGELEEYIEERVDGTRRNIKYFNDGNIDIIETSFNGKKYIYSFEKGKLRKYTQGLHQEENKKEKTISILQELVFSQDGKLMVCKENYKYIKAFNKNREFLGDFTTTETIMYFDTQDDKTFLKRAKQGVCCSSSGKQFVENEFEFDENGELLKR